MTESKINLQRYAMLMGTYMGGFWIAKFILLPLGLTAPLLLFLFIGLTIYVPFLGYRYVKMYRDRICQGRIRFLHAWGFTIFMFVCASMLTAIAHYIYFAYIDQGYIIGTFEEMLQSLNETPAPGMDSYLATIRQSLDILKAMTPTDITFDMLLRNIYYCIWLAIPIALIVSMKKRDVRPENYDSTQN